MSFSSFSKDFTENSFTSVENCFITKYLPEASGDAVRAYLYGLYLCGCAQEFDAESTAKLLKIPYERLIEIFGFWEECGLVQILSKKPLYVEYLPVHSAVGKPKPIRPEKYAEFNLNLFAQLQKAGSDLKPYEHQRVLTFLENTPIEHEAFLLIVEYCIRKDGGKFTVGHVLNKAAQLVKDRKYTYEQIEIALSDFNNHEKELQRIFIALGISRKPLDADYDLLSKWRSSGMEIGAVYACAEKLKKGSLSTLDNLISELLEANIKSEIETREYLAEREEKANIVFKIARKLGVKVQNPRPFVEEYAEKWLERGYDEESLSLLSALGLRLSYGFPELDALLDELYRNGIVDLDSVKTYCSARDKQLKLLQNIQSVCGVMKKTQAALDMIATWRSWSFSDEMILEAAKRSANASAPLPYMNKLLSEWKRMGVFGISEIPAKETFPTIRPNTFRSEVAIAADERSDRERFYSMRRDNAMRHVARAKEIAEKDKEYCNADAVLRAGEIELAKAELYHPERISEIHTKLEAAKEQRTAALIRLNLSECDFTPKFICTKCSDTGFLPDGRACDCYKK